MIRVIIEYEGNPADSKEAVGEVFNAIMPALRKKKLIQTGKVKTVVQRRKELTLARLDELREEFP